MLLYINVEVLSMKIWTKIHIKEKNQEINIISKCLTNYLYGYGPINDICRKYGISNEDRKKIDKYTANRIAGILMIYLSHNIKRLNDIVNKYNIDVKTIDDIEPEIEGYIEKKI